MKTNMKLFFIFLGILFSTFMFWNRFLRERLPKEIFIIFFSFRFIIIITIMFSFLILLLISIKSIFSVKKNNYFFEKLVDNKHISSFYNNIIVNIIEGPIQLYELFYDNIRISFFIEPIHKFFFNYNIYNYCHYIILFSDIWRIILLFSFLIDVFHYQKFYYLYKTIYILIIPLILNIILFMINHHAKNLVEYLSDFVSVSFSDEENCFIIEKNPNCKEEINKDRVAYLGDLYINAEYTTQTFLYLNEMKKKANYYLNIFICTLYIIGWFYCLYISSKFYQEFIKNEISVSFIIFFIFCFFYNFSLLMSNYRKNFIIFNKVVSLFKLCFIKSDDQHFANFVTSKIEQDVLLFTFLFNFVPKYSIIFLFIFHNLIKKVPYIFLLSFLFFCVICLSNLYLYLLARYLKKNLQRFEYYFSFITKNNKTFLYYKTFSDPRESIIQQTYDTNFILKEWVKLKKIQTFIYYAINKKIVTNIYTNCIYIALIVITLFLLCITP